MKNHSIRLLLSLSILAAASAHAQKEVVIDNLEATFEGSWTNGAASGDKYGSDYRFAYCVNESDAPSTVTFRPKVPVQGKYNVEISFPRGANRSSAAPWTIYGSRGSATVKVNQRVGGGSWMRIASDVDFDAGTHGYIKLSNNTGETDDTTVGRTVVVADAVRLVPATGETTSKTTFTQAGPAIEVDDKDVVLEGNWAEISPSRLKRGQLQHYAMAKETATCTATFRPNLPHAGKYDVEIFFLDGNNRSTAVPWVLVGADGESTGFLDQSSGHDDWVRIASGKSFAAGSEGYLQINNGTGKHTKAGNIVVADAARFIPVDAGSTKSQPTPAVSTVAAAQPPPRSPAQPQSQSQPVPVSRPGATYSLDVQTVGAGKVKRSSDQIRYPANSSVTLTAVPDEGYVFGGWTGDVDRMLNPLPLNMSTDVKVTANFWEAGIGVIMDNSDADIEGNWIPPEGKSWGNPKYDDYQYSSAVAGQPTAWMTYEPNLPRSGLYDIYLWYPDGQNRAESAAWEINYKGGSITVKVNEKKNGGQWNLLAPALEFEQGRKGRVRVSNKAAPIPSVVVADAVAFVYVGAP